MFLLLLPMLLIAAVHDQVDACAHCLHSECMQTEHGGMCMHCESGYVPLDGQCTATAASFCLIESDTGGSCLQCDNKYRNFLNGCYSVAVAEKLNRTLDSGVFSASMSYMSVHVFVNGQSLFTSCFMDGELPINGVCAPDTNNWCIEFGDSTSGYGKTCFKCAGDNVFYFKGGCYSTTTTPGSWICQAASDGICNTCNTESSYVFSNPSSGDKTEQCISCGDGNGADGYKGVENCGTCTPPSAGSQIATCSACPTGHKFNVAHTQCFTCEIQECLNCDGYNTCEKCDKNSFIVGESYSKICVGTCPTGTFPFVNSNNDKACYSCSEPADDEATDIVRIVGCKECTISSNTLTCNACKQGYKLTSTGCEQVCADVTGNCSPDACTAVIGPISYCTNCKNTKDYAPIDGVCKYISRYDTSGCKAEGAIRGSCSECGEGYFLFMNGCYKANQIPGSLVCSSVGTGIPSANNLGAGLCNTCGLGYRNSGGYCIPCNNQYCTEYITNTCICKRCQDGALLVHDQCVVLPDSGCMVPYCAKCEKSLTVCTKCEGNYYVTPLHGCIKDCGEILGYHNNATSGKCVRCKVKDCYKCHDSTQCLECSTGYGLTDARQCVQCPENCFACSHYNQCVTCKSNYILSDSKVCEPESKYNVSCKDLGAKYIKYEPVRQIKGSVKQKVTASMCSKCDTGKVPINGKCVSATTKTLRCIEGTGESAGKCTGCVSDSNSNSVFLYSGGCYDRETSLGKSLCLRVGGNGACTKCPQGYMLNTANTLTECVPCPENCMKCDSSNCLKCDPGWLLINNKCVQCESGCLECNISANKCTSCSTGYYVAGATDSSAAKTGPCRKCDDTRSVDGWRGVAGCTLCVAPIFAGDVLCLSNENIIDTPIQPLTSAAIAGISITAIALIAAVVGVLVWRFACRAKSHNQIKMVDMDVSINTSQNISSSYL